MRYRIWSDGKGSAHPFNGYFAGYIDTHKEAKKEKKKLRKLYPKAKLEIHDA